MDGNACDLCATPGGTVLWKSPLCRVVRVEDADYPGYCRVIWNAHVREMSDLDAVERETLMKVVLAVEEAVRAHCAPDKINLASLGNQTPHVHWHVIPRWNDDRHFPEPIWGAAQRVARAPRASIDNEVLRREFAKKLNTGERSNIGK